MPHDLESLTRDQLLELLREQPEPGVRVTFSGKATARQIARRVRPRVMRSVSKFGAGGPTEQARNLLVEGENLQAMTTLYRYRGQVDLILADPPYNTGSDFRYNDRWDTDPNDPELGDLVGALDGARHTKWMRFMWPRLSVMRDMLRPSGVLAICIDHRELFRLGQMLDELFGEENRLGIINWQKTTPKNDSSHVSTTTEYVLVYAKNEDVAKTGLVGRSEKATRRFKNPDGDPEGEWKQGDLCARGDSTHPGMVYAIQSPFTGQLHYPPSGRHWGAERKRMKAWLEAWGSTYLERNLKDKKAKALVIKDAPLPGEAEFKPSNPLLVAAKKAAQARLSAGGWPTLYFGLDGLQKPVSKVHVRRVKAGVVPTTYWADEDYAETFEIGPTSWANAESGRSREGIEELDAIVGKDHGFETVKPLKLFKKIIQLWCPPTGLVLDPFAGSGTAGHAVLDLNAESDASRRFILIEQGRPERGDPYARSLTADRLQRVVTGNWAIGPQSPLEGGFAFMALRDKVDAKAVLAMERDEMTDTVIASHFDAGRRGAPSLVTMTHEGYKYLVARNPDNEGFFLVWTGGGKSPVFNDRVYDAVVKEARKAGLKPVYHVYARFNLYQSDDVRFYQIPTRILLDFGLSEASDPFNNEEEGEQSEGAAS